jgi:protein ImuB
VSANASQSRRFLSLWLKRFSTDRIARLLPERDPRPLVVAGRRGNGERLVAIDAAAERCGLRAGLALAEARAMIPDINVFAEDPQADADLLERMADWFERYTPLVAVNPSDGLLLDIGGCTHLFGGEQKLADDLATRMASFGFTNRVAVAGTLGAAWALARHSAVIIAPDPEREALLPLPLAALRLPSDTVAALARVGLKRIGDISGLARAPLAARFGPELLRQLDRALGFEDEPLVPRLAVAPYVAEQRFAEPVTQEAHVLHVIGRLARRLAAMLERRGEGARSIALTLFRADGEVRRIATGTSRPSRDPAHIRALFIERLASLADPIDPGFGFDLVRLAVSVVAPLPPEQVGFADEEGDADLGLLVDRLSARLGRHRVLRHVACDSHIPERAAVLVPAQSDPAGAEWAAFREFRASVNLAPRPLRLLARPEPIEVLAMVPDGAPVRFHWRRLFHEVATAEGPERIENLWWADDEGLARDYFRVEDREGRRFWLYRAGLYREMAGPRWFLHGFFA